MPKETHVKKTLAVLSVTALGAFALTSCSDDSDNDSSNGSESTNGGSEEAGDESGGDYEFEDQFDLGLGETGVISTSVSDLAYTIDGVEFVGFWGFLDDFDYTPNSTFDPDLVAIVEVTLENIGDEEVDADDAVGNLEFSYGEQIQDRQSGQSRFIAAGDEVFDIDNLIEGDLAPGESVSGIMHFPVFDSNYDTWGMTISPGIVGCCASNDITWVFDADHGVDVEADAEQYR